MQIGMVGAGRMGASIVQRLLRHGHPCVVYDHQPDAVAFLQTLGAAGAASLPALVAQLARPRRVWLMLPAATVDEVLDQLAPLLSPGDLVIDGGNTYYRDDIRRANALEARGVHHLDVGTSGGVAGLERGYCLMVGGTAEMFSRAQPLFVALAPGLGAASRTPGRPLGLGTAEEGYLLCGPHGAGHFVKMVHNGIEYGVMAAYAEGLNVLRHANVGKQSQSADAETTPLRDPEFYRYDMDLPEIAEVWRRGSVIGSWLLDLAAMVLHEDPDLVNYQGRVSDSGEGRWTLQAGLDEAVPTGVLSAALYERFASRGQSELSNRMLSAMRHAFGGHIEKPPA